MVEYQSNSRKKREEEANPPAEKKTLEKIVTGEVVVKPPSIWKRSKGMFFGGDIKSAGRSAVADVLLPAARNTLLDAGFRYMEKLIMGDSPTMRGRRPEMRSRIQYNSPIQRQFPQSGMLPGQPPIAPIRVATKESNSIRIASRSDADNVLTTMVECVSQYGVVSLADLNELLGQHVSAVDHNWGWTNLNHSEIRQVSDGWMLELPPMEEIKWA